MHVYLQTRDMKIIFKIILSTQNSSDVDLVKDIVSANKATVCYLKFSLYLTKGFT